MPLPLILDVDERVTSNDRMIIERWLHEEVHHMVSNHYIEQGQRYRETAIHQLELLIQSYCGCSDAYVPFVALNIFDRFVSRHPSELNEGNGMYGMDLVLVVIGCYLLALRERSVSMSQPGGLYMPSYDPIELRIMTGLEYRFLTPISITPVSFVRYALSLINIQGFWEFRSLQYLMSLAHACIGICTYRSINLLRFRPSVVAVASILVQLQVLFDVPALEVQLGVPNLVNRIENQMFIGMHLTRAHVVECTEMMLQLWMG